MATPARCARVTRSPGSATTDSSPVRAATWLLWFGPGLLLVGGLAALALVLRQRSRMSPDRFEPDELDIADEIAQR